MLRHQGRTLRRCGKCHTQWIWSCRGRHWSRAVSRLVVVPTEPEIKNGCADEARQQFTLPHPTAVTVSIRPTVFWVLTQCISVTAFIFCWFLACLPLRPGRLRRYFPPKCRAVSETQKTVLCTDVQFVGAIRGIKFAPNLFEIISL
jgi:hypothetical protein